MLLLETLRVVANVLYTILMKIVRNIHYKLDVNLINKEFVNKNNLNVNLDNLDSLKKDVQKMTI